MKHKFKEGDRVAHIEELELKLYVTEIIKESRKFPIGKDNDGNDKFEIKTRMIGIKCHWWHDKELHRFRFHSSELVPFEVAQTGREKSEKWLEANK